MATFSFRRRPRKCSHPLRSYTNSIQDKFLYWPLIEEKVTTLKKSRQSNTRKIEGSSKNTTRLPNLDDHRQKINQEKRMQEKLPFKNSTGKRHSEVIPNGKRTVKRKVVNSDEQTVLQNNGEGNVHENLVLRNGININRPSSQEQPEKLKNFVRGLGDTGDPVLVIKKKLYTSDVDPGLQRFSIPCKQVVNEFLTEKERKRFNKGNKQEEIDAILIGSSFVQYNIKLRKWYMSSSSSYVLVSGWNEFVEKNGLESGIDVQLRSFKRGSKLYFILIKV
nr:uncharacterized protein LOC113737551 [Coffea arabica]